ncbi:uncharacterized protein NECHADRAFT_74586 [Fusarium vanettenii 77-13-4]|uniref:Uncharacterized protein n=1 Tax=Fusarium vanettenii (strain ATCC MYA-4622 / CBS 123669 / FGSC 9596 / NRRL 45880 / 77-13-4) TaxID=660122 RepID=C7YKF0_FUSV7|nr:uncharacterized protein NECHADRAFT_74586 [Fusarium vanettenii 77-13-4]EEU48444.1 hypothetical protein NECHADRAFT_74586 [Fusarium vanettenii 77-13-4]
MTNNQGVASKRPQPSSSKQDKYTRPPRVSFGVELEFLVFHRTNGMDDETTTGLPPVQSTKMPVPDLIAQMLRGIRLDAYTKDEEDDRDESKPPGWLVCTDGSVSESGMDAEEAHEMIAYHASSWIPRYLGRARKLGEAPVVSRQKLRQHIRDQEKNHDGEFMALDPECPSDDSDWEAPNSKPFFRPKKPDSQARRHRRPIPTRDFELLTPEEEALLDGESITRDLPPQVNFNLVGLDPLPAPSPGSTPKPFLEEGRHRQKQLEVEKILEDPKIMARHDEPTWYPAAKSWKPTWPGVKELLSCDAGVHQIAQLMSRNEDDDRYASSNWATNTLEGMTPGDQRSRCGRRTIESRLAGGSLDAEWVVTWAKIQCRLLEWARDAEPSAFMEVLCKLARDDHSDECTYDVVDLLRDLGMYTEIKICEERLERAEEAWYQCMLFEDPPPVPLNMNQGSGSSDTGSEGDASSDAVNQGDTSANNTDDKTSSGAGIEDDPDDIYDAN